MTETTQTKRTRTVRPLNSFGKFIYKLVIDLDLTIEQLASDIGISTQTLSKVMREDEESIQMSFDLAVKLHNWAFTQDPSIHMPIISCIGQYAGILIVPQDTTSVQFSNAVASLYLSDIMDITATPKLMSGEKAVQVSNEETTTTVTHNGDDALDDILEEMMEDKIRTHSE